MSDVRLTGVLITPTREDQALIAALLPEHLRLTHLEEGCMEFDVVQDANNPTRWLVSERFASRAAFAAHQERVRSSEWGRATAHLVREYEIDGL